MLNVRALINTALHEANNRLPHDFYEIAVHEVLMDVLDEYGVNYHHEYHYQENKFKMDFLFDGQRGLEIKVAKGNIPCLTVTELSLYFPLCESVMLANYYPCAPKDKRLTVFEVSRGHGIQLKMPLRCGRLAVKDYKVHLVGNWDGVVKERQPWGLSTFEQVMLEVYGPPDQVTESDLREAMER